MTWPTSPGRVVSSSVVHRGTDGDLTYYAEVVYEFNVNNTTFRGMRIAIGHIDNINGYINPSRPQEIVNRYPQDKNVIVYYMPNNPKKCLLELGVHENALRGLRVGLFCLIISLILVVVGIVLWFK